jgi:hypothetical protein
MARSQTWTRNVSKKQKKAVAKGVGARGIVDGGALENLKRRAEDLGLIVHARRSESPKGKRTRGGK